MRKEKRKIEREGRGEKGMESDRERERGGWVRKERRVTEREGKVRKKSRETESERDSERERQRSK